MLQTIDRTFGMYYGNKKLNKEITRGEKTNMANKKEQASEQMRHKILATTIKIIGREGYGEVTASNLSQKAKISKGALYHHFTNLDEIRYEALAFLIHQLIDTGSPSEYESLKEFLQETGKQAFTNMDEYPVATKALFTYVVQALVDNKLKDQLQGLVNHALQQYKHAFSYFYPDINDVVLTGLVQIVDAYIGGATLQCYILNDTVLHQANWERFSQMLIDHIEQVRTR